MITKQEIQPVITKKVVITDSLFASYVNAIAEHLLPYQWKVLNDQIPGAEKSHCIDNFRIAAGEMEGTHQGAVFQDTDLYKMAGNSRLLYCQRYRKGIHRDRRRSDRADRARPGVRRIY